MDDLQKVHHHLTQDNVFPGTLQTVHRQLIQKNLASEITPGLLGSISAVEDGLKHLNLKKEIMDLQERIEDLSLMQENLQYSTMHIENAASKALDIAQFEIVITALAKERDQKIEHFMNGTERSDMMDPSKT